MTRKKGKPNKNSDSEKSGTKRKVISPLYTDGNSDITHENNRQGGVTGGKDTNKDTNSELVQENKRFHSNHNNPSCIFTFDPNCLPPDRQLNMNYQQGTYGAQFMPSPPGYVPQMQQNQSNNSNTMPPWANMLLEEIKSLKTGMSKIDSIEKTVTTINSRFADLEIKVNNIEQRVGEVEKSCTFISKEFDSKINEIKEAKAETKKLKEACDTYERKVKSMNTDIQTITDRLTESESRSMRNNLIFYGIPEGTEDDCEQSVKTFIQEKLTVNTSEMVFDRAHRLGNDRTAKKPRPIVVRFTYYKEREIVRAKAYDMNDALRRDGLGVSIQRPRNVREARKALYHVMKQAQDRGQTAKFYGDKLYIDGDLYVPAQ